MLSLSLLSLFLDLGWLMVCRKALIDRNRVTFGNG